MKNMQLSKNSKYAIASILSPIIAGVLIFSYQNYASSEFWNSIVNSNGTHNSEGAMMAFAEIIEIIIALAVGCFIGIIFAIKSISLKKEKIGVAALILNTIPFVLLSLFYAKGVMFGI